MRNVRLALWALVIACALTAPARAQDADECPNPEGWKPTEAELQAKLADHEKWLKNGGRFDPSIPGKANFCNANLRKANLSGADLSFANLRGADLFEADLRGADLWETDLQEADLHGANLSGADLYKANLSRAGLSKADLSSAYLSRADLSFADFSFANLRGAELSLTNLSGVSLYGANLSGAVLLKANLLGAYLQEAHLLKANLSGADLSGADLSGANLENANFTRTRLTKAIYQPSSAPAKGQLSGILDLTTVRFDPGEHSGLVQLRAKLRETGLRRLEREATFALERGITRHAFNGWKAKPERSTFLRLFTEPGPIIEGVLRLVFFQWTTAWGLYYGRPIKILFALIVLMTFVYIVPLRTEGSKDLRNGIFRIWPKGRIEITADSYETADNETVERLTPKGWVVLGFAFYFSALSAFQIGWRDLNVGSWLARLQFREFGLRARGWVRFVSGLQSLVSVYLLAMWALTYFGRPFQ